MFSSVLRHLCPSTSLSLRLARESATAAAAAASTDTSAESVPDPAALKSRSRFRDESAVNAGRALFQLNTIFDRIDSLHTVALASAIQLEQDQTSLSSSSSQPLSTLSTTTDENNARRVQITLRACNHWKSMLLDAMSQYTQMFPRAATGIPFDPESPSSASASTATPSTWSELLANQASRSVKRFSEQPVQSDPMNLLLTQALQLNWQLGRVSGLTSRIFTILLTFVFI
jgi:hypothetical protein